MLSGGLQSGGELQVERGGRRASRVQSLGPVVEQPSECSRGGLPECERRRPERQAGRVQSESGGRLGAGEGGLVVRRGARRFRELGVRVGRADTAASGEQQLVHCKARHSNSTNGRYERKLRLMLVSLVARRIFVFKYSKR